MAKERPILFNGEMVRAILAGRKTQTRRIIKPQPLWVADPSVPFKTRDADPKGVINCPYGKPGDRLWVRETWVELLAVSPATSLPLEISGGEQLIEPPTQTHGKWNYDGKVIAYRANSTVEFCDGDGFMGDMADKSDMPRWRPSIHMPREASRILLEVVNVRVERLQNISDEDAMSEGLVEVGHGYGDEADYYVEALGFKNNEGVFGHPNQWGLSPEIAAYRHLWESINGPDSWDANPWVWVVEFKVLEVIKS